MRNISFALTTGQVRAQTKTVTRRIGWQDLQPGTMLQPVIKVMGLKRGETVTKIGGPLRVVSVTREPLFQMGILHSDLQECSREGFPELSPAAFIQMFIAHHGCLARQAVTRIEFEYVQVKETA